MLSAQHPDLALLLSTETELSTFFVVTIDNKFDGISEPALDRFLVRARRAARVRGQVHVLIISSRRMKSLNRQFRGKNKATDVLSFPAIAEVARDFAGDIVISAEIAAANARLLGHPVANEIKVLILHGVLHLAGHDHENDHGKMARMESRLRRQLHLKEGLIERTRAKPQVQNRRSRRSRR